MLWKRLLAVGFWLFIAVALIWQMIDRNAQMNREAEQRPPEIHNFYHRPSQTLPPAPDGPILRQTSFTVERDVPNPGMFTCHVVVTNVGNAKATNIQILVRPYYGVTTGGDGDGHNKIKGGMAAANPFATICQSLAIPDLAPGQSCPPQSITFSAQFGIDPGFNPDPQIAFEKAK